MCVFVHLTTYTNYDENEESTVSSGKDTLALLLSSERVFLDCVDWLKHGEPEQICLRQWEDRLCIENEFRCFVHDGNMTAISQFLSFKNTCLRDCTHEGVQHIHLIWW